MKTATQARRRIALFCFVPLSVLAVTGKPAHSHRAALVAGATNPAPFINQPLVPDAAAPGGSGFTLAVNGAGFVSGSVVNWNAGARSTTFVSSTQLTSAILASDIASAGTASVTVANPVPGGGTSNVGYFGIAGPISPVLLGKSDMTLGQTPVLFVTAGDFNGDGKLDLAVATGTSSVSVLLGNGDGTFQPAVEYPTGTGAVSVTVGDFNGDGKLDLAVADANCVTLPCVGTGLVSILLGNGDGTFQAHADYTTGGVNPNSVSAGDFNGDGKLDVAVVNQCGSDPNCDTASAGQVSVLLGNGDGTFQSPKTFLAGMVPGSIVAGDFNRDGKLDVAAVNFCGSTPQCSGGTVSVLLGNGDGTFQVQVEYVVGLFATGMTTADFNGDGNLDLVTGGSGSTVSVLLGNGDGTFGAMATYATGPQPNSVTTGDFNGDGKLDLATCTVGGSVSILLGNGDGTFQTHTDYANTEGPLSLASGDFNADGRPDLVSANDSGTLSLFLQTVNTLVTLSPTSLTFGVQLVGTASSKQSVNLTNSGNGTLDISSVAVSKDFLQGNTCGSSVAAGGSCTFSVAFRPTAPRARTGTLNITDTAPGSPQTISLTGTGTAVKLSPPSLNFGSVMVGTSGAPETVTLTNAALSGTLHISSIHISGTDFHSFAETDTCTGETLGPGVSCTITVTFTPRFKGTNSGAVDIYDNGGASPQAVALSGTGT